MKTFLAPHNSYAINPGPGYRILACCEKLKPTDEWHQPQPASVPDTWHLVTKESGYSSHRVYRRAINIDDPSIPPPIEWEKAANEGYVISLAKHGQRDESGIHQWWEAAYQRWSPVQIVETNWQCDIYVRRPVSQSQVPSVPRADSRPVAKAILKPGQSIIVSVGTSHALGLAVQQVAFAAGVKWTGKGDHVMAAAIFQGEPVVLIFAPDKPLQWDIDRRPGYTGWSDALYLDARTDIGLLIDLLAVPPAPTKPVGPTINGYVGEYIRGNGPIGDMVRFGCADISVSMIEFALTIMTVGRCGNRTIADVGLSSGVRLNRDQIAAIIEWVTAIRKTATTRFDIKT